VIGLRNAEVLPTYFRFDLFNVIYSFIDFYSVPEEQEVYSHYDFNISCQKRIFFPPLAANVKVIMLVLLISSPFKEHVYCEKNSFFKKVCFEPISFYVYGIFLIK